MAGLAGAWLAAEVLVVSVYSQEVLGYSALAAGLIAIPQGVGGILRGVVGPRLLDRVGVRTFLVGNCLLAAAGLGVLFRFPITSDYPLLALVFIAIGFGTTNVVFGATVTGSSGVRNDEQGLAGAVLNGSRQIGSAIGVAVLLSLATSTTAGSSAGTAGGYRTGLSLGHGHHVRRRARQPARKIPSRQAVFPPIHAVNSDPKSGRHRRAASPAGRFPARYGSRIAAFRRWPPRGP